MSVQEFLDNHMLSRKIENAVNAAVRAKSLDPVLFISNHIKKSVSSVITKITARQVLDSRGIPTIEVDLYTNKGMFRGSSPSGNCTGMQLLLKNMAHLDAMLAKMVDLLQISPVSKKAWILLKKQ